MAASAIHPVNRFLLQRMQKGNISSTPLVFTFFCDVVTQHGGEIWLGSIIRALGPLGVNERRTRTSVYRLVQDGWLESRKQGRRSYYRLSQTGQNYYQRAAGRIYASNKPEWDGAWSLLFTSMVAEEKRDALNRGLTWLGYGRLATGVYALPRNQRTALDQLLADLGLNDTVVTMQAKTDDVDGLQKLVLSRWKLDNLSERYEAFIEQYTQARRVLLDSKPPGGHTLLLLRILLIHEYRRILLSDPELPAAMLPANWHGDAAQSLSSEIYRQLAKETAKWVSRELLNTEGQMQGNLNTLKTRFTQ